MADAYFIYGRVTDPDTGETVYVRKFNTEENIVAWGDRLNRLANDQTLFADGTYQPTKSEILGKHSDFFVSTNPLHVNPPVDYADNENVMLRAVAFKVTPGTFTISLSTTQLGLATNVTTATAQVFFNINESVSVDPTEMVNPNNALGFPIVYGASGLLGWEISIPTDIVLSTVGDNISGTLHINIIEHNEGEASLEYNVGSCEANTYNLLIGGYNVRITGTPDFGGGGGILPKTTE